MLPKLLLLYLVAIHALVTNSQITDNRRYVYGDANTLQSSNDVIATSINHDEYDNYYLSGHFIGKADFDMDTSKLNRTSQGSAATFDAFYGKYGANDELIWLNVIPGNKHVWIWDSETDQHNNFYAVGTFNAKADFDPDTSKLEFTPKGVNDIFAIKVDSSGQLIWAKHMGARENTVKSIYVDSLERVYIVGSFSGRGDFDPDTSVRSFATILTDHEYPFVLRLNKDGNFSMFKSLQCRGSIQGRNCIANDINVDKHGDIFLTGAFNGNNIDMDPGTGSKLVSNGNQPDDAFVLKLDSSGNYLWDFVVQYSNVVSGEQVVSDQNGNVYVAGIGHNARFIDFDPGPATKNVSLSLKEFFYLLKLDSSGNFVDVRGVDLGVRSARRSLSELLVDPRDNIYLSGTFLEEFDVRTDPLSLIRAGDASDTYDAFILKYDTNLNSSAQSKLFLFDQIGDNRPASTTATASDCLSEGMSLNSKGDIYSVGFFEKTIFITTNANEEDTLKAQALYDTYVHRLNYCTPTFDTIFAEACSTYTVPSGNTMYTESGTYIDSIFNDRGCDSIITIQLEIGFDEFDTINPAICSNMYFAPSGKVFDSAGTYLDTIQTRLGCDSIITINLTIDSANFDQHHIFPIVCEEYTSPSGKLYTVSGTFSDTVLSALACDSIFLIDLTIAKNFDTLLVDACDTFVSPSGKLLLNSGSYSDTVINSLGCDSIIQIELNVLESSFDTLNVSSCNQYTSPSGKLFFTSGSFHDTVSNAVGCDSVILIHLNIDTTTFDSLIIRTCDNYLSPSGKFYTHSGSFRDTIASSAGCDSIIHIQLTVDSSSFDTLLVSACDAYLTPSGKIQTQSGIFNDTIVNAKGCDSIIQIDLQLSRSSFDTITVNACNQYTSPSGKLFLNSGVFSDTIGNSVGCDSIIEIQLSVDTTSFGSLSIQVCDRYLSPSGKLYTHTGNFKDTIVNAAGCDSIIDIQLTVDSSSFDTILVSSCDSYLTPSGKLLTQSGVFHDTLVNSIGCDSIIHIELQLFHTSFDSLIINACDFYETPSGKIHTVSGTFHDTISNVSSCDSIIFIDLSIHTDSYDSIQVNACDTYFSPSGKLYTLSGEFQDTISNVAGCDSIINIQLNIEHSTFDTVNVTSCDRYHTPSGKILTSSGTHYDTLMNGVGCDSIIRIELTILESTFNTLDVSSCSSYVAPSGRVYSSSGTFSDTITNTLGCDSIISINLNIDTVTAEIALNQDTLESPLNPSQYSFRWLDCNDNFSEVAGENQAQFRVETSGDYALEATNTTGCVDTSFCINVVLVGILESTFANTVHLFPNPTNGQVQIELERGYQEINLSIRDASGKLISTNQYTDTKRIDLNINGARGLYFIELWGRKGEKAVFKVIKN